MQIFSARTISASALACSALLITEVKADSLLHPLFSSNAVLQRDRKVPIWGEAPPQTKIEVLLDDQKTTAIADANGRWSASIGPRKAGLGHKLVVSTPTQKETRENIAFGDVWICSGQSNMEWRLFYGSPNPVVNAEAEAKNANYPAIRLLTVPHVSALSPQRTLVADWKVCNPETVRDISAVGYFFGREIHQKTGVPIGLIDASWGGTTAQVWASGAALGVMPDFKSGLEAVKNTRTDIPFAIQYNEFLKNADAGMTGGWSLNEFNDSAWKTAQLPGSWELSSDNELKTFDGIVWYRREIVLDEASAQSGDLTLNLGPIDDLDMVYWNGEKIGEGAGFDKPRTYKIPVAKLKSGKNTVAVRVLDTGGNGGFGGTPDSMKLLFADGKATTLSGAWKYKVSNKLSDLPASPVDVKAFPNAPSVLFNGMISPLLPYGVKGAIWYQGESNAGNPKQYETLLPIMINDWRARFGSGVFPFYIVQLAGYMNRDAQPGQTVGNWPTFRESQEKIAQKVGKSGIAVTTDVGDEKDIHPRNKQDVGKRLAYLALKNDYGLKIAATGPTLKSARRVGRNFVLELANTGGEIKKSGDLDKAFILAGEDKKWAWGKVVSIQNLADTARITLSAPEVSEPVAVRFGWSNFPLGHLYNKAEVPAAPFRSDKW